MIAAGIGAIMAALFGLTGRAHAAPGGAPPGRQRIGPRGHAIIKRFEGWEPEPYQDIAGNWTVGYGHLIQPGEEYGRLTRAQGDALMIADLQKVEAIIDRNVRAPLTQAMRDALGSWIFNLGEGNLQESTMLKRLNQRDYAGAADALTWYNKARVNGVLQEVAGLVRRRGDEKALFLADGIPGAMA